jgi:hypothetical protein
VYRIVELRTDRDDCGVYSSRGLGPFGTPLVFRGTLEECVEWRRVGGATSGTYRRARDGSPPSRPAQGTPSLSLRTDGRVSPSDKAGLAPLFLKMESSPDHPSFGAPGGSAGFFAVTSVRGPEGRLKEG